MDVMVWLWFITSPFSHIFISYKDFCECDCVLQAMCVCCCWMWWRVCRISSLPYTGAWTMTRASHLLSPCSTASHSHPAHLCAGIAPCIKHLGRPSCQILHALIQDFHFCSRTLWFTLRRVPMLWVSFPTRSGRLILIPSYLGNVGVFINFQEGLYLFSELFIGEKWVLFWIWLFSQIYSTFNVARLCFYALVLSFWNYDFNCPAFLTVLYSVTALCQQNYIVYL